MDAINIYNNMNLFVFQILEFNCREYLEGLIIDTKKKINMILKINYKDTVYRIQEYTGTNTLI